MNVRLASMALQRWMTSIVFVMLTFSAIKMVYWISNPPTWYLDLLLGFAHSLSRYGVYMFMTPLLLLPLLASSYAEVNYEGIKVIQVSIIGRASLNIKSIKTALQSILPTDKRVMLFQYLYGQPIQMTVYGHALSYGTMGKPLY
jgi:hypothetical protein